MTTDLFVFGGTAPVPPSCRRPPAPLPAWTTSGADTAVLELPLLEPRAPATRIIPSLSVLTDREHSFRFEAQAAGNNGWTCLSPVGPRAFPRSGAADPALTAEIDVYTASPPATGVRLRLRIHSPDLTTVCRAETLVTVSLSDGTAPDDGPAEGRAHLHVPALSQMETPDAIRQRICSPTCVAMVLGYWKRPVGPGELASEMFDPRHDLYGVWPAAIRAAARRGVHGYLLRFPSWAAAAWCLDRGVPVIASVRYTAGELRGAAIESTAGHLLVLTGYDRETVFVNDPAAPAAREVPRRYALADIERVWLHHTGVGHVLFRLPPAADPKALSRSPETRGPRKASPRPLSSKTRSPNGRSRRRRGTR